MANYFSVSSQSTYRCRFFGFRYSQQLVSIKTLFHDSVVANTDWNHHYVWYFCLKIWLQRCWQHTWNLGTIFSKSPFYVQLIHILQTFLNFGKFPSHYTHQFWVCNSSRFCCVSLLWRTRQARLRFEAASEHTRWTLPSITDPYQSFAGCRKHQSFAIAIQKISFLWSLVKTK